MIKEGFFYMKFAFVSLMMSSLYLHALDETLQIEAPAATYTVGEFSLGNINEPVKIVFSGTTGFIGFKTQNQIGFFDGSNPFGLLGTFSSPNPQSLGVYGTSCFIVTSEDVTASTGTLSYFDTIIKPYHISSASQVPVPGDPKQIAFCNSATLSFVTNVVSNSADKFNPTTLNPDGSLGLGVYPTSIMIAGTTGFIGTYENNKILYFDASQNGFTYPLGSFSAGDLPTSLSFNGTTGYATLVQDTSGYIGYFDITNPASGFTGTFSLENGAIPSNIAFDGNIGYITSTSSGSISIFDASAPLSGEIPTITGQIPTGTGCSYLTMLYPNGSLNGTIGYAVNPLKKSVVYFLIPQPSPPTVLVPGNNNFPAANVIDELSFVNNPLMGQSTILLNGAQAVAALQAQGNIQVAQGALSTANVQVNGAESVFTVAAGATLDMNAAKALLGVDAGAAVNINGQLQASKGSEITLTKTSSGDTPTVQVNSTGKVGTGIGQYISINLEDVQLLNGGVINGAGFTLSGDFPKVLNALTKPYPDTFTYLDGGQTTGVNFYTSTPVSIENPGSEPSKVTGITDLTGNGPWLVAGASNWTGVKLPSAPIASANNLPAVWNLNGVEVLGVNVGAYTQAKVAFGAEQVKVGGLSKVSTGGMLGFNIQFDNEQLNLQNLKLADEENLWTTLELTVEADAEISYETYGEYVPYISVDTTAIIDSGAFLDVNINDYPQKRSYKALIETPEGGLTGGFDPNNITITGDSRGVVSVITKSTGYYLFYDLPVLTFPSYFQGNAQIVANVMQGIYENGALAETNFIITELLNQTGDLQYSNVNKVPPNKKIIQYSLEKLDLLLHKELEDHLYQANMGSQIFLLGGYDYLSQDARNGYSGYHVNSFYQLLGYTHACEKATVLTGLGVCESYMSTHPYPGKASYNTVYGTLGASSSHKYFKYGIDALFGYSFIEANRKINLVDFYNQTAKTNHGAWNLSFDAKIAYERVYKEVKASIYENFGYIFGKENDYVETGALGANQKVKDENLSQIRNAFGFYLETHNHAKTHLFFDAAWVYEHYYSSAHYSAAFVGTDLYGSYSQTVPTSNYGRIQAGLKGDYRHFDWKLAYTGLFGKGFVESSANLQLGYKF
jgi:hypothetical protein